MSDRSTPLPPDRDARDLAAAVYVWDEDPDVAAAWRAELLRWAPRPTRVADAGSPAPSDPFDPSDREAPGRPRPPRPVRPAGPGASFAGTGDLA